MHLKRGGVDRVTSVLIPVGAVCVMSAMLAKGARNVKRGPSDGSASVGGFEDATDRRAGRDGETDDDGSTRDRSQA